MRLAELDNEVKEFEEWELKEFVAVIRVAPSEDMEHGYFHSQQQNLGGKCRQGVCFYIQINDGSKTERPSFSDQASLCKQLSISALGLKGDDLFHSDTWFFLGTL